MDPRPMWCARCERVVAPKEKVNYPMTAGILGVLVAITIVFVWVTFFDQAWGPAETVVLTVLITVLPFAYMRLTRRTAVLLLCPFCGGRDLARSRQRTDEKAPDVSSIFSPRSH